MSNVELLTRDPKELSEQELQVRIAIKSQAFMSQFQVEYMENPECIYDDEYIEAIDKRLEDIVQDSKLLTTPILIEATQELVGAVENLRATIEKKKQ